jgi:hypothetical protein
VRVRGTSCPEFRGAARRARFSNGYLQKVTDALGGAQASYTYDSFGRVHTYTDVNGFTVTYSYDNTMVTLAYHWGGRLNSIVTQRDKPRLSNMGSIIC